MAISIPIYSNSNSSSKTISFDFVGDILADSETFANVTSTAFYFKITTSAKQDNNVSFPVKIVKGLDDLVLNGNNCSALYAGSAADYANVKSMVIDYVYDFINGHAANAYGSGCSEQKPMKF